MAGVLTVAAYICGRYEKEFGQKIDEMKLQKMMYFAQREALIQTEKPLFRATFYGFTCPFLCQNIEDMADYREYYFDTFNPDADDIFV